MSGLDRFIRAQAQDHGGIMTALEELAAGQKTSHWIWHVAPQLRGLSSSSRAIEYGIADLHEAMDYLRLEPLRERYLATCLLIREWTRTDEFAPQQGRRPLCDVMGGDLDALKLVSSLTLFEAAAARVGDVEVESAAHALLLTAEAQGLSRCERTLASVRQGEPR